MDPAVINRLHIPAGSLRMERNAIVTIPPTFRKLPQCAGARSILDEKHGIWEKESRRKDRHGIAAEISSRSAPLLTSASSHCSIIVAQRKNLGPHLDPPRNAVIQDDWARLTWRYSTW